MKKTKATKKIKNDVKTKNSAKKLNTNGPFNSPKGMRDIIGEDFLAYQGFFERASEVALYYGFKPIELPMLESEDLFVRGVGSDTDIVTKELYALRTKGGDRLAMRPEFTAGVVRSYIEQGMNSLPQPVMLYYYGPIFRHEKPQKGRYRQSYQFGIEILGTEKSIADALSIKLVMAILEEAGLKNISISLNSIGDKECRGNFKRDLLAYYKKHLGDVCKDCANRYRTNPIRLLDCKAPECQIIKEGAPSSVGTLCEPCRKHFKELLEYLETLGIEYTIDNTLVRGLDYYTRTVYEVFAKVEPKNDETIETMEEEKREPRSLAFAGGGRYDPLAKQIGANKNVPGVGFSIGVDRVVEAIDKSKLAPRIVKKCKVFFIQFGIEAKLASLKVTEMLRKAKVPVQHSISKDSLGSQLGIAEKLKVPYAIILGAREAIDGTVIVRNMENRKQETIKLELLSEHLKMLK